MIRSSLGAPGTGSWKTGAHAAAQTHVGALLMPDEKARTGGPPSLFQGLTDEHISQVINAGHRKVFYRGSKVFTQGSPQDGIYLIESGRIRVFYFGPSGREITLAYWHPGNFVGGPDVFNKGTHVWSGVAAMNSSVLHIPGGVLRRMALEIPALAIGIIEGLSFKGRCYSAVLQMLGTRSPAERLGHLLLNLVELYGVQEKGGHLIAAAFTHADLANMIGVTRQWVTTTLKRLTEAGVLEVLDANILVMDSGILATMRDGKSAKAIFDAE
jgi:CRP/FNR family cyclic AMP-dependent transcriptional regulator